MVPLSAKQTQKPYWEPQKAQSRDNIFHGEKLIYSTDIGLNKICSC